MGRAEPQTSVVLNVRCYIVDKIV